METLASTVVKSLLWMAPYKGQITSITPYPKTPEVHLDPSVFFENFSNYKGTFRDCEKYPIELSEIVEGVKFFCICTVEDFNHAN